MLRRELNTQTICQTTYNLNNELLVSYSSHVLINEPLVPYLSDDLNNEPIEEQTILNDLNTKQVCYSDPYCIVL